MKIQAMPKWMTLAVKVGGRGVPLLSGCIPVFPTLHVVSADVNPTHLELDAGSVQLAWCETANE